MKAIDRYITLANEVISLYETYQVRNYTIDGLEYIKRLQRDVQTFNTKDIEDELIDDYPDVATLQRRLDYVEMKLDGYLIDCQISDDDWLGDGGDRCKHLVTKLGQKIGMEYVIRLHSILEFLNNDRRVIVEMIERLRNMDAQPQGQERPNTEKSNGQTTLKPKQETEREKKYFAKAIEAGLMEKTDSGYRWLHNNGLKASLGYFLNRVFNPRGTAQIPYQRMESLFNVSRLDTATDQTLTAKKPQKWRKEIDMLFDD